MVLTPLLTVPVLNVVGFSAAGPVAGEGSLTFLLLDNSILSNSLPNVRHARRWDSIHDRECRRR
jgi:hypothetical protein